MKTELERGSLELSLKPMNIAKLVLAATAGWYANDYFDSMSETVLQEQSVRQYMNADGMNTEQHIYQLVPKEQLLYIAPEQEPEYKKSKW